MILTHSGNSIEHRTEVNISGEYHEVLFGFLIEFKFFPVVADGYVAYQV